MNLKKIKGKYTNAGKIELESMRTIEWNEISKTTVPELPSDMNIDITFSIDENDFLLGNNGIVWATYDLRQSEIIHNALLAQQINSEVKTIVFEEIKLFLVSINNERDINDAIDFIWRDDIGLRLKPDWNYLEGEINKSFEQWLSGR